MLSILSNEKKIAPDDLIQELINPESTNEVLDEIYKITKVDLNSLNFNDEPILHVCCKKDIYISVLWLLENKIDINIQNDLSVEPSFKYKLTNYDDESFAFNSRRKDSLKEYKIELKKDLKSFGFLNLYISYEDNDSNHALYDTNTRNIGLTYIKGFKW